MNRPIKFRAWDNDKEKMDYSPVYVNPPNLDINSVFSGSTLLWMQFTGLTDKNGKDLYEGDLCKDSKGDIIEIGMGTAYVDYINQPLELIGNIYENKTGTKNNNE